MSDLQTGFVLTGLALLLLALAAYYQFVPGALSEMVTQQRKRSLAKRFQLSFERQMQVLRIGIWLMAVLGVFLLVGGLGTIFTSL